MKTQTHSIHALAQTLEVDRQTLVRALASTPADEEKTRGRPTWKVSSAVRALELHRSKNPRAGGNNRPNGGGSSSNGVGWVDDGWRDPILTQLFAEEDAALAHMASRPTLEGRRAAALLMRPMINRMHAALCERGVANGHSEELATYRADRIYQVGLGIFFNPCQWTAAETSAKLALT